MKWVFLHQPAWQTTFPRLIEPLPDEWLASLLLRCDEVNTWGSGTTCAALQRVHPNKSRWQTTNMICPPEDPLSTLAEWLAVPLTTILATTYRQELIPLFGFAHLSSKRLAPSFRFRICPQCLRQRRYLRRTLVFPQLQSCPEHQLLLLATCQCGASLRLITQGAQPFACHACGLDWGKLPRIPASQELSRLQQTYLSHYALFLSNGASSELIKHVLRIIGARLRELYGEEAFWKQVEACGKLGEHTSHTDEYMAYCSLSALVSALVYFHISSRDILASLAPLTRRSSNPGNVYYHTVAEMIANLPVSDISQ